jgi:ubiquitin-protein ligase
VSKNPPENVIAVADNSNIFKCHFVFYGLKDEFSGGVYHGQIIFPVDYPLKAPKVIFLTPNGRFQVGREICLSFTSFHQESWSPTWSINNMLIAIISFMYEKESKLFSFRHNRKHCQLKNRKIKTCFFFTAI